MTDVTEPDERLLAARAARSLIEAARHEVDVREMIAAILARHGMSSIADLAETDPQGVIALAEEVGALDEQTFKP